MPKRQLDAVGSILEALTGVLEVEYLKKQRSTSNEYDTVVSQLEKMVRIAKDRSAISKVAVDSKGNYKEGPIATDSKTGKEYWGGVLPPKKSKKTDTEGKVSKGGGKKIMKKKRDHTIHGL